MNEATPLRARPHLNGYKISNPTILARIEHEELEQLLRGEIRNWTWKG
jgi:hypothetical protein